MLLDAVSDPNGPPVDIPIRPLTGTTPGCVYAELATHKRPFPKRSGKPYDRWRNSGGKRGATVIRGGSTTFVRRYGNVRSLARGPVSCLLCAMSVMRRGGEREVRR